MRANGIKGRIAGFGRLLEEFDRINLTFQQTTERLDNGRQTDAPLTNTDVQIGVGAMRRHRKSKIHWLFLLFSFLLLSFAFLGLVLLTGTDWLPAEWQRLIQSAAESFQRVAWNETTQRIAGTVLSVVAASVTLFATWHFAEINLPRRIEDLKNTHTRDSRMLEPKLLAVARQGLGSIPPDIETSRLTMLRKWLSWGDKERARVLAASANFIGNEARALQAATHAAHQAQITAHLIRGYQHGSDGDDDKAFEEFQKAVRVSDTDLLSRDIAAGWARRMGDSARELGLLHEMRQAAIKHGSLVDHARTLRREAELLRRQEDDLVAARDKLIEARDLFDIPGLNDESKSELMRVLILLCEVQCDRGVVRQLIWPNGTLTRLLNYASNVAIPERPEERSGEAYGKERISKISHRVAELIDDSVGADRSDPASEG